MYEWITKVKQIWMEEKINSMNQNPCYEKYLLLLLKLVFLSNAWKKNVLGWGGCENCESFLAFWEKRANFLKKKEKKAR